ncbi:MAG: 2Fe-2S iron-sulfur cluster-binding protein [Thermoanaerobaculia bacterium]|nr:Nitrate reductase [Thermoanaerobaculia bacterium]MCK6682029.1 2Fe-2S iron-sulfur cluster-binding protein [Thermoanaerobaculia bacterium]
MAKVTVDGREVVVPDNGNVLEACRIAGVDVPHFCYHPRLSIVGQCRMCMVEIEGMPKIQASCTVPVRDGMVVSASSEKALAARNATMEFLLINHPLDCPICDQAGECKLQDNAFAAGLPVSRTSEPRRQYPGYDRTGIGPHVIADMTRCIQCTRCIRFCAEIAGTGELTFIERGGHTIVWTHEGKVLDNEWSACTADVCPVGALTTKDFRFRKRVWWLDKARSVCTGCEIGCNISIEHRDRQVFRFLPRPNPDVNDYWMCDYGRFRAEELNAQDFTRPVVKDGGSTKETNWGDALERIQKAVDEAIKAKGAASILVIGSANLSTEENYLLNSLFRTRLGVPNVEFVVDNGALRRIKNPKAEGNQEGWLKGLESAPNSRGAVAAGVTRALSDSALEKLSSGKFTPAVLYVADAAFAKKASDPAFVQAARKAGFVAVHARTKNALTEVADVVLPVASLSGKEGTFVNSQRRIQAFSIAIVPPPVVRTDMEVLLHLGKRWGVFDTRWTAGDVFELLKKEIPLYADAERESRAVAGYPAVISPASAYDSIFSPEEAEAKLIAAAAEGRNG